MQRTPPVVLVGVEGERAQQVWQGVGHLTTRSQNDSQSVLCLRLHLGQPCWSRLSDDLPVPALGLGKVATPPHRVRPADPRQQHRGTITRRSREGPGTIVSGVGGVEARTFALYPAPQERSGDRRRCVDGRPGDALEGVQYVGRFRGSRFLLERACEREQRRSDVPWLMTAVCGGGGADDLEKLLGLGPGG